MDYSFNIRPFASNDTQAVIALWENCELTTSWNNPEQDIARKQAFQPELFLVGERIKQSQKHLIASAMFGYDGHRGWLNYFAVLPTYQRQGFGKKLLQFGEEKLKMLGCQKLNLQIRESNLQATKFYQSLDYQPDRVISYGKRLSP